MVLKNFTKFTHKTLAGFMAVWLSGVVFLLCCQVQQAQAAEDEFCPLKKLSAHCDKADANAGSLSRQSNEQGMDCCDFLPLFFDKTRTIETNQPAAADAPATGVESPQLVYVRSNFSPAKSFRSTVLLKNNTFLKNRAFRI